MQPKPIRILLVDDHPVVLKGLAATLEREPDIEVAALGTTLRQAVDLFRVLTPDIALVDVRLDGEEAGILAIQQIRREFPSAKIIVFSALTGEETVYRALQAGAVTFLSKETSGEELIRVVREVHCGKRPIPLDVAGKLANRVTRPQLTARELEVLKLIAEGLRNKEIGSVLRISQATAQGHVKNILAKLKVNDRTRAVTLAAERGIIHLF
jgi:two-component system NarL family response regulator